MNRGRETYVIRERDLGFFSICPESSELRLAAIRSSAVLSLALCLNDLEGVGLGCIPSQCNDEDGWAGTEPKQAPPAIRCSRYERKREDGREEVADCVTG